MPSAACIAACEGPRSIRMDMELLKDPAFWLLVTFIVPLIFRVPIAISLGVSALIVGWWWDMGVDMLSYNFFAGIAKVPLLAIPFFILAGFIMERAGIAARIVMLVETLVGNMTGGLAIATVAALGLILIPAMVKSGYDKPFAAATVSVTSGLAIVIPPSIAFIVYGGIADVSVPALFAAGFIPGVVVALFLMASVYLTSRKKGYRGKPRSMPVSKALREAFWGVMTPVVILGGIYGGVFTPTEAAAVAIFYGLFVGVFIYRTINKVSILIDVLVESVKATAVIMFVVTCAGLYAWVASTVGLVERGASVLLSLSDNPTVLLLLINVILFIAGMLLDAISIYYVLLPFLMPIMAHFGWDPVWFGVMMTINLALGQVTPPVAVNLYVGAKISNLTMEEITPPVLPMLLASMLALVVIVLFPDITLFLPRLLGM